MNSSIPFQYAHDVLSGNIVTGNRIKLACERFFKWIDEADEKGFHLNHQYGLSIINFFPTVLNHTKGKLAGEPFHLAAFQQFTMYNVFAWQTENKVRRINTVYDKRAKKNGKSAEMAGLALYGLSFDMEMEAEIYVGATKEDQAKICWLQAKMFIDSPVANPMIKRLGFQTKQKEIWNHETNSVLRPLGGDSKTQDGINSHISIIDEYHAHPTDAVKENLESSSVQRKQPITWHITTAGTNIASVCKNYEDMCIDVLSGIKEDDSLWIMIHDLDDDDDWEDVSNWVKANPLMGQGLNVESLKKEFTKAKNQPSKAPNFKTKHLNKWVDAYSTRIPQEIWMQNTDKPKIENFIKYGCAAGMDLSSRIDLSAYVLVSNPDPDGFIDVLPFIFCPKDTVRERSKEDRVPYDYWQDVNLLDYIEVDPENLETIYSYLKQEKLLTATPGNQIDYDYIEKTILRTFWLHGVKWIDYDRYKSTELVQKCQKQDVVFYEFGQNIGLYSFPTQEFERLVFNGKIRHGGHPILQWCVSNLMPFFNNNEDMRYVKKEPKKRIDPIQSIIMGLAGVLTQQAENNDSQYNDLEEITI